MTRTGGAGSAWLGWNNLGDWEFMASTALDLFQHTHAAIVGGYFAGRSAFLTIALASADEAEAPARGIIG